MVDSAPLDRLLIETDCPLLAPVPYRGKRNEPAYVTQVAQTIAAVKNLTFEDVAAATRRNTEALFSLE